MKAKDKKLLLHLFETHFQKYNISIYLSDEKRTNEIIASWRQHFIPTTLNHKESLWHTFSYKYQKHLSQENAILKFDKTYLKKFIIFSDTKYYALECLVLANIDLQNILKYDILIKILETAPCLLDIYICHMNYAWTFVIPHEIELGPYFSISSNHSN